MKRNELMKPCPLCSHNGEVNILCPICKGIGEVRDVPPSERKKLRNNDSRLRASRTGKYLSKHDWALIEDLTLSTATVARRLNRSIKSIESARYRLRKEKKGCGKETEEPDAD